MKQPFLTNAQAPAFVQDGPSSGVKKVVPIEDAYGQVIAYATDEKRAHVIAVALNRLSERRVYVI